MARKEILQKGDPVLTKKSHPVTQFDKKLHALLDDMHEALARANGAGLAAVQIGILRRVVLVLDSEDNIRELINPVLEKTSGEQVGWEGCLSLSGLYGRVKRPMHATVKAQDRDGNWFTLSGSGLVARCFCHELEHLEGEMFDQHSPQLYTEDELEKLESED